MFSERLKMLRKKADITQEELAKILGVERSSIGKYEASGVIPSHNILIAIADYFGVSVDYLLGRTETEKPDESKARELFNIVEGPEIRGAIPIVGSVRCGWNGTIDADYTGEYEPAYDVNPQEHVWMHAKGDSMEPDIREGDLVLVHLQPIAENGDIVVAIVNGENGTIKKFTREEKGILLSPLNKKYTHVYIPSDSETTLTIYGIVVRILRNIR